MPDEEDDQVVETDPSGRFERYPQSLGKGAFKQVFKAFDSEEGIEVAWNQLRLDNFNQRDVHRILSEITILESLRNENIINLYYSWVVRNKDGIEKVIFITELMTSGTLKQYLKKTRGVIKHKTLIRWARQILKGLDYLHTRNPVVIHRDLKCQNIFVNGNSGQAKIGDLGLACQLNREHMSSVLGTPEFMAPELYDEQYDEKVDIYAFGMVVIEIVTKDYPYSECQNQAQIFKKVSNGVKPLALYKVTDQDTREFVELCINHDPKLRPSVQELLAHPFMQSDSIVIASNSSSTSLFEEERNAVEMLNKLSAMDDPSPYSRDESAVIRNVSSPPQFLSPILHNTSSSNISQSLTEIKLPPPVVDVVDADTHTYIIHRTPHSIRSSNSEVQRVIVEFISRTSETEVQLKMIYRQNKINFPFNLKNDTVTDVISEMVLENLIDADDQSLARRKLEELIRVVLLSKPSALSSLSSPPPNVVPYQDVGYPSFDNQQSSEIIPTSVAYTMISSPTSSQTGLKSATMPRSSSIASIHSDTLTERIPRNNSLPSSAYRTSPPIPQYRPASPTMMRPVPSVTPRAPGTSLGSARIKDESVMSSTSSTSSRPTTPIGFTVNPISGQLIPLGDDFSSQTNLNNATPPAAAFPSSQAPYFITHPTYYVHPQVVPTDKQLEVPSLPDAAVQYYPGISNTSNTSSNESTASQRGGGYHAFNAAGVYVEYVPSRQFSSATQQAVGSVVVDRRVSSPAAFLDNKRYGIKEEGIDE